MSRFDEARQETRRLRLARAIPARAKAGQPERVLCGFRDCRGELPRLAGGRPVGDTLLVGFHLDGWRESDGVWQRGRGGRARKPRGRPSGTTELERARAMAMLARQIAGHQYDLVGRIELALPAYFSCPRCGRINVVAGVAASG